MEGSKTALSAKIGNKNNTSFQEGRWRDWKKLKMQTDVVFIISAFQSINFSPAKVRQILEDDIDLLFRLNKLVAL